VQELSDISYLAEVSDYSGTISRETTITLPFVNVFGGAGYPGDLSVTKALDGEGADPERLFRFWVSFDTTYTAGGDPITYRIGDGPLIELAVDGFIWLRGGETALFENLSHETSYTVVEDDYSGDDYLTDIAQVSGHIVGLVSIDITVTNSYWEPEIEPEVTYALTLSKTVLGAKGHHNRNFIFDVSIADSTGSPYSGPYTLFTSPGDSVGATRTTSDGTIALKHGQRATIAGLVDDQMFTVSERTTSGYITTVTVDGITLDAYSYLGFIAGRNERVDFTNTFDDGTTDPKDKDPDPDPKDKNKDKDKTSGLADNGDGTDLKSKTGDQFAWATILTLLLVATIAFVIAIRREQDSTVPVSVSGATPHDGAKQFVHWNLDAERRPKKE